MKSVATLFLILAGVSAGAGTPVQLQRIAVDLPPGTRVQCEMKAKYVLVDPATARGKNSEPAEIYQLPASGTFACDFVVGPNGTVPSRTFMFQFDKRILAPPQGLSAAVLFPTKYTVNCPSESTVCTSRSRDIAFGIPVHADASGTMTVCLQFRGGAHGPFVGVATDCSDPRNSKHLITRSNQ